jgi:hypothetical protein
MPIFAIARVLATTGLTLLAQPALAQPIALVASQWQEVTLGPDIAPNEFEFLTREGEPVLRIRSQASISMMVSELDVDLSQNPILCWRWRVSRVLESADMTTRAGDDYAARLYVNLAIPRAEQGFGLRMQLRLARAIWGDQLPDAAINYVWDNRQAPGVSMPNAYTDRVMMVVMESGAHAVGQWQQQSRDVARDIEQFFGSPAQAVQIALAADTDNTGEQVTTEFARIRFAPDHASCDAP